MHIYIHTYILIFTHTIFCAAKISQGMSAIRRENVLEVSLGEEQFLKSLSSTDLDKTVNGCKYGKKETTLLPSNKDTHYHLGNILSENC